MHMRAHFRTHLAMTVEPVAPACPPQPGTGWFGRHAFNAVVVPEASAREDMDEFSTIMEDHLGVCKPRAANSPQYLALKRWLEAWLGEQQVTVRTAERALEEDRDVAGHEDEEGEKEGEGEGTGKCKKETAKTKTETKTSTPTKVTLKINTNLKVEVTNKNNIKLKMQMHVNVRMMVKYTDEDS